jgi:hypothetical protein
MALAAAVLAIAWATLQWMTLHTELVMLRTELQLAQLSLKDAQQRREADRILWQHQIAAVPRPSATASASATSPAGDPLKDQIDPVTLKIVLLAPPRVGSSPTIAAVGWNPVTQEGVFAAQNLPPPAPGQVYRLWALDPQYPQPVAAGVVGVESQTGAARSPFKPGRPLQAAARFFVSLERQDGGSAPEGPVVLASP